MKRRKSTAISTICVVLLIVAAACSQRTPEPETTENETVGDVAGTMVGGVISEDENRPSAVSPPPPPVQPVASEEIVVTASPALKSEKKMNLRGLADALELDPDHSGEVAEIRVVDQSVSTFSIDVDTASYTNVRRFIREGLLPPPAAIRIEELVNYFDYADPAPTDDQPFAITTEVASSPWSDGRLLRIALKGRELPQWQRKPNNLVFLIDTSGSMESRWKMPLLKRSLRMLVDQLTAVDTVSIVTYAGSAGILLQPTPGDRKSDIIGAIDGLGAHGSTAGADGIRTAYRLAIENFNPRGNNRVLLATDGDFNVGVSSVEGLERLITERRDQGIYLSVLGFDSGAAGDARMETLADRGNGNYAAIDSLLEARKVLVEEMGGTLHTIASDVKIQLELDPAAVSSYRLVGYENRRLANRDFEDDTRDAGELGSGHSVVALYELQPAEGFEGGRIGEIRLRYKNPGESSSRLVTRAVMDGGELFREASDRFRFSAAVAWYGEALRSGGNESIARSLPEIRTIAVQSRGLDLKGYRGDFLEMVESTIRIADGATGAQAVTSSSRD